MDGLSFTAISSTLCIRQGASAKFSYRRVLRLAARECSEQ